MDMSTKKVAPKRVAKVYPDEQKLEKEMAPLQKKKADGKHLTDAEAAHLTELRQQLGALRFIRLAKHRAGKCILTLRALQKLGSPQYHRTEDQIKKLQAQVGTAVADCFNHLSPKKTGGAKQIEVDI